MASPIVMIGMSDFCLATSRAKITAISTRNFRRSQSCIFGRTFGRASSAHGLMDGFEHVRVEGSREHAHFLTCQESTIWEIRSRCALKQDASHFTSKK